MPLFRRVLVLVIVLLNFVLPAGAQDEPVTLTVYAAASLTDAFEDIGEAFQAEYPQVTIVFNFGSSSDLAAQLAEGAPGDVFASANRRQLTVAREAGRITGASFVFARNRLVVALPADNPADIQTLSDLANPGVRLVIAAPDVPVRDYTDTMLARMAEDAAYGPDFSEAVLANVVSEEGNVRQVSAKVALGEADAGIVYASDITADIRDQVITLDVPDAFNTLATYPIGITDDTAQREWARLFVDYVLSEVGQAALADAGFIPVRRF